VALTGMGSINKETVLFGALTRRALSKFQVANGIKPANGNFGPITRALVLKKMNNTLSMTTSTPLVIPKTVRDLDIGMTGDDVKSLQTLLISKGYSIPSGATGSFGTQTKSALSQYQKKNNIVPALGYFGEKTREQMKASRLLELWW